MFAVLPVEFAVLPVEDIRRVFRLVTSIADPTLECSFADRKRLLLDGAKEIIDADVYLWSSGLLNPEPQYDSGISLLIDGGWSSDHQKKIIFESITNPKFLSRVLAPIVQAVNENRFEVWFRDEIIDENSWETVGTDWRKSGLNHFVAVIYPLSPNALSVVSFHRIASKPAFSMREKAILQVVFSHVDWLHRYGTNDPVAQLAMNLSPRERQVLIFLLDGLCKQKIAEKLTISEHTVGGYVKNIYREFSVNSHAELLAVFLLGQRSML